MKIIPKLNLNQNPAVCEEGSLTFARNMKVADDGTLVTDAGYETIEALRKYNIVGHIVGLNNKIYFFTSNVHYEPIVTQEVIDVSLGEDPVYTIYKFDHNITKINELDFGNSTPFSEDYYFAVDMSYNGTAIPGDPSIVPGIADSPYSNITSHCFKVTFTSGEDGYYPENVQAFYDSIFNNLYDIGNAIVQDQTQEQVELIKDCYDILCSTSNLRDAILNIRFACTDSQLSYSNVRLIKQGNIWINPNSDTDAIPFINTKFNANISHDESTNENSISKTSYVSSNIIVEYDEVTGKIREIPCSWKYKKGVIDGCVTTNISGEQILTICESVNNSDIFIGATRLYNKNYLEQQTIRRHIPARPEPTNIATSKYPAQDPRTTTIINSHVYDSLPIQDRSYSGGIIVPTDSRLVDKIQIFDKYKNNLVDLNKDSLIPIKHINLSFCSYSDDESIYSQAPKVPIANLIKVEDYAKTIPNGTYVFFIRYAIRDDVYTGWYQCSHPIFAGVSEYINTLQGGIKYVNLHKDSANSFVFNLSYVLPEYKAIYKKIQFGFIISHDDAVDARIWKQFDIDQEKDDVIIYFDYDNVTETNIDDFLNSTYELYNVKNITPFKNKLYLSNYIESNFNPDDIQKLVTNIDVEWDIKPNVVGQDSINYKGIPLQYNSRIQAYDKTIDDRNIKNIFELESLIVTPDSDGFIVPSSGSSDIRTSSNAIEFKGNLYKDADDPNLFVINKLENKLASENKCDNIFGYSFTITQTSDSLKNAGLTPLAIIDKYQTSIGQISIYNKDGWYWFTEDNNNLHPLYSKDMPYAYAYVPISNTDYVNYSIEPIEKHYGPLGKYFPRDFYNNHYKYLDVYGYVGRNIDNNFSTAQANEIATNFKKAIEGKARFVKAYIYYNVGANERKIDYESYMDDPYTVIAGTNYWIENISASDENIANRIKQEISIIVNNNIAGIKSDGKIVLYLNGEYVTIEDLTVVFKLYTFENIRESVDGGTDDNYSGTWTADLVATDYKIHCAIRFANGVITTNSTSDTVVLDENSLMPFSTYNVYAHFVDEHQIITNGVLVKTLNTSLKIGYGSAISLTDADTIRLLYKVSSNDFGKYKGFFLSIASVGNKVIECFDYHKHTASNKHVVSCIELDALLYTLNEQIKIITETGTVVTSNASYHTSGSSNPLIAFGNYGMLTWDIDDTEDYSDNKLYVIITSNTVDEHQYRLIKCSPYLPLTATDYVPLANAFYNSFICKIKKPDFDASSSSYVSGSDVYSIDRTNGYIKVEEYNNWISLQEGNMFYIRSNFNLNYLSITEDLQPKIFSVGKTQNQEQKKQVATVINSAILSFIYELKPMYKDFTTKYYQELADFNKIQFDNTIRVSNVLSDETFNNSIFYFMPKDYYNVPTDRGVIVKLFSIANNIYTHTEHSLFKFDGNQTITTSDKDITLQESEPFDTGIVQIIDSQYGYGGISDKHSGCATFDFYFFFDKRSKHIFGYGGQNQLLPIDATIYETLSQLDIKTCNTIHDELNNRMLFNFLLNNVAETQLTLSYNYKTKTFISIHDVSLINAFNTRDKVFSYRNELVKLFTNTDNTNVSLIFGPATTSSALVSGYYDNDQKYNDYVDSIFNVSIILKPDRYELESVDSIAYLADYIAKIINTTNVMGRYGYYNKTISWNNPVKYMYISTDCCISTLVNTTIDDSSRQNIERLLNYKGFKRDRGAWTSNYFRNNINSIDVDKYSDSAPYQPGVNIPTSTVPVTRQPNTDNNSLVYGRYFVINLAFDNNGNVKIQEINVNSKIY